MATTKRRFRGGLPTPVASHSAFVPSPRRAGFKTSYVGRGTGRSFPE